MEEVVHLIPLSQGRHALVDKEDWEELRRFRWHAALAPNKRSFYAQRYVRLPDGRRTTEPMHRRIMGLERGDPREIDHVDQHPLNNCRSNLRIVDTRRNSENRRDQSPHGVGVQKRKSGRFRIRAWVDGKRLQLGGFVTAEEAQEARRTLLEEHE